MKTSNQLFILIAAFSILFLAGNSSNAQCPPPTGISVSAITTTKAKISWNAAAGAVNYKLQWRVSGTTTWTKATVNATTKTIMNLTAATVYQYRVRTVCSGGSSSFSAIATFTTDALIPTPDHVVVLILENHGYTQVIGATAAPHINALANDTSSALFTQSYAITHPSQPNYLQFYSGSNQGVTNDNTPPNQFTTANLGRELINAGKSFATYSEDLPSVGYNGATSGNYARKHNPAANWMGTGTNQIPTTTNQPYTAFPTVNFSSLPTVSYVVPNQNNDMHNGSDPSRITTADNWMFNNLNNYIQWAKTHNSLFILTFDEDNGLQGNRIATIFTGQTVLQGQYSNTVNHYDVLRTIEDMYGLTHAGSAATATPITYCWKQIPRLASADVSVTNENIVEIYPNPVSDFLNINFTSGETGKNQIEIIDHTGRIVLLKENIQDDESIDISTFPAGIYILQVVAENETTIKKFVKE